jgi:hypothetical protein
MPGWRRDDAQRADKRLGEVLGEAGGAITSTTVVDGQFKSIDDISGLNERSAKNGDANLD